jgi:two-component system, sensor histidine kinase ChiS
LRKTGSDPETGLFDRAGLVMRLEQEISRSFRYGRPLCFVLLKPAFEVGDKARACASFLRASLRLPDVVGHCGSGVFAVILPESSIEVARQVFTRLISELAKAGDLEYRFTATQVEEPEGGAEAFLDRLLGDGQ